MGDGNAAIVVDLTCVGGKYFPIVLPKRIAYATLLEYILPMTSALHEELHIFVGCRSRPWPPQAEVTLESGEVVTVLPSGDQHPAHIRAFALFQPEAEWGPMHHFFRVELHESICVLFRSQRYCFNSHTGTTLLDFVCERFRLDPNRIVTCVFPIEDLDVQGDYCPVLVAVQDLPPLAIPGHPTRQDCFTLCDLRPLGLKPQFIYTHVPTHHVPSLASDFGVSLPRHMQVKTLGGRQLDEVVQLEPNATLVFYSHAADDVLTSSEGESGENLEQPPWQPGPAGPPPPVPAIPPEEEPLADVWPMPSSDSARASLYDVTIPHDHGWNEGITTPADADTNPSTEFPPGLPRVTPSLLTEMQANAGVPAIAVVYVPDVLPELHHLRLEVPCSISQTVSNVQSLRSGDEGMYFPDLTAVTPQPIPAIITFVAQPRWFTHRPVILFDCRRVDQSLFACIVWPTLSRESILLAAGLRPSEQYDVYVHDLLQPLEFEQRISLSTGMLVTLVPLGCGAPATASLEDRLHSTEGWGDENDLAGPSAFPGQHFWVLTDGPACRFTVAQGRRGHFRTDLASQLGTDQFRITFKVSRLPVPPARRPDRRIILILDCRYILQAFVWQLLEGPEIGVQTLVNQFQDECPPGHIVSITGAPVQSRPHGAVFLLNDGQVLTVAYIEDMLPSEDSSAPPDSDDPGEDGPPNRKPRHNGRNRWRTGVTTQAAFALLAPEYTAEVPVVTDRFWLLNLAGLPPQADVDIFCPCIDGPVSDGVVLRLKVGDCITFASPTFFLEPTVHLCAMARTALAWEAGPPFPEDRYCVVSDDAYTDFVLHPARSTSYKTDIAATLNLRPWHLMLSPAQPPVGDSSLLGRTCRTVIAAGEQLRRGPQSDCTVGFLDCRPMLGGWHRLYTADGWINLEHLRCSLTESAPPGTQVTFLACPSHWRWLWLQPGQVVVASLDPIGDHCHESEPHEQSRGTATERQEEQTQGTHSVTGRHSRSQASDNHYAPQQGSELHGQGAIVACRLASWCCLLLFACLTDGLGLPVVVLGLQGRFSAHARILGLIAWILISQAELVEAVALHSDAASTSISKLELPRPSAHRPVPTPARATAMPICLAPLAPTPAEDLQSELTCLHTLLEESLSENSEDPFIEARAILETLCDHFTTAPATDTAGPMPIRLEAHVGLSHHQASTLHLQQFLPHCIVDEGPDWLDSDLTEVLGFQGLPLEVRTELVNIATWHTAADVPLEALEIYTDGSATCQGQDISPSAWAFAVFVLAQGNRYLLGHASSQAAPPGTPYFLGEVADDALTAELLALCWSLCWAVQYAHSFAVPVHFCYDAMSAGRGTFGKAQPVAGTSPERYAPLSRFAVALRQYLNACVPTAHRHVTGHTGCLGNELCDALAKLARKTACDAYDRCLPSWPAHWARHPLADWAWATVPGQSDIPRLFCFDVEVARGHIRSPLPATAPKAGTATVTHPAGEVSFTVTCVSLNVLTLRDGKHTARDPSVGMRVLGRKDVLKASLDTVSPLFVGLQETRLPQSAPLVDQDFLMYSASASDSGTGGCSLWISKRQPLYTTNEGATCIADRDVTIIDAAPRFLVAHIQTRRLSLQVHVLHAPSTANVPVEEVRSFWDERAQALLHRPEGCDFIVLCDANSRLGEIASDFVGTFGAEQEGPAGGLFHEFLTKIDAVAPSTWEDWHTGPHTTWVSPTGHRSRIDYVLLPRHWTTGHISSFTLPFTEHLQLRDDHIPVFLSCQFARRMPPLAYTTSCKQVVRPDPQSAGSHACQLLSDWVPVQPWHLSVDEHYQGLAEAWLQVGEALASPAQEQPRQPYLTADTLLLVRERAHARSSLKAVSAERQHRWRLIIFAAFVTNTAQQAFSPAQTRTADSWLRDADLVEAELLASHLLLVRRLRQAVATDRIQYLDGLVTEVAHQTVGDAKALYKVLRRAFPAARSARRQTNTPLPMLKLADGTVAATTDERAEAWRAHFAAQEAGIEVTDQDYAIAFAEVGIQARDLDISCVPTLAAVERNILAAKTGKAAGPDGITAELLRLDATIVARQLMPVFLKACLHVREPITFRGGDLVCLAKRAGQALQCDAYRSILVSSVPGKLYHRGVREALKPLLLHSQMPFQGGVAPGQGIECAALAVRTFYSLCLGRGVRASLTFFDLQAAFYQVLRQSLVPLQEDDTELLRLLHCLRLPEKAICELRDHLAKAAQLPLLGASSHATAIVQDMFRGTWFRLSGFAALTLTKRGTRPGDPTADLLFGFTLSALAKAVQHCLASKGLLPDLPSCPDRPDFIGKNGPVCLGFPAWADDFVSPQTGDDTAQLITRTSQTITTVVDFATSAGMTVKFGRDKTALLMSPKDICHASEAFSVDDTGSRSLQLHNSVSDIAYHVPLVESYRHLGGIVTSSATPAPDLHFRFAQAMGTLKPLRRKLFGAREIPIATRSYLLRALVISRFAHSAAAIIMCTAGQLKTWERYYVALWMGLGGCDR
ncbi:hypothetical protein AK812_SmicGene12026 [Symbiodinium microadriaticum]|uniref:Uncharacterized protein n=1 Tax=Symbiodinium microadriaticum TaxID=2951 RepID=A0A1Q9EBI7_SYMMI|nr:hypothetical protein AK812_SmicGene12026 [Symbiodinium microadriaticum]